MAVAPPQESPSPRTIRACLAKSAAAAAAAQISSGTESGHKQPQLQMRSIPENNASGSISRRSVAPVPSAATASPIAGTSAINTATAALSLAAAGSSTNDPASAAAAAATSFTPGVPSSRRRSIEGRKTSRYLIGGGSGSRNSSRRSSVVEQMKEASAMPSGGGSGGGGLASSSSNKKSFKYWMQVTWEPEGLQELLMAHPAVEDCTVQDFNIDGIGGLPRAYVVMKSGYSASADELLQYLDSRILSEAEKLRAGIVFVDKLAKDPSGKLFISLDKYNKDAEGMDYEFIRGQPKVKTSFPYD